MPDTTNMVVVNGVRYRYEDALRLGLVQAGTPVADAGVKPPARTDAPAGLVTTQVASIAPAETPKALERPGKSGTKADWQAFALANGKTEADLEGLKRDDIAALFPAE